VTNHRCLRLNLRLHPPASLRLPLPRDLPQSAIYGVFVDDINQLAASRIVQAFTAAVNGGAAQLHIMFQSWGGFIGDGVMLYNLLRSVSVANVWLYNSGQVQSAAVTAYLGAKHRVASARSIFMLHKSAGLPSRSRPADAHVLARAILRHPRRSGRRGVSPQGATAAKMEKLARSLVLDDERSEAIWREHLKLPDDLWKQIEYHDVYITGEEAVEFGLATQLGEFSPPPGTAIYKV
jgi:ATP-dependent Clp protease, protease subunit